MRHHDNRNHDQDESVENPGYHSGSNSDEEHGYSSIYDNHEQARRDAEHEHAQKELYRNRKLHISAAKIKDCFHKMIESLHIIKDGHGVPPPYRSVATDISISCKILKEIESKEYNTHHEHPHGASAHHDVSIEVNEDKLKACYEHVVRSYNTFEKMGPISDDLKRVHSLIKSAKDIIHSLMSHNTHHSVHTDHKKESRV